MSGTKIPGSKNRTTYIYMVYCYKLFKNATIINRDNPKFNYSNDRALLIFNRKRKSRPSDSLIYWQKKRSNFYNWNQRVSKPTKLTFLSCPPFPKSQVSRAGAPNSHLGFQIGWQATGCHWRRSFGCFAVVDRTRRLETRDACYYKFRIA